MIQKNFLVALAFTAAAALIVGCGENGRELSPAEKEWVRNEYMKQKYGWNSASSTTTQTITITVATTVTLSTTVNAN